MYARYSARSAVRKHCQRLIVPNAAHRKSDNSNQNYVAFIIIRFTFIPYQPRIPYQTEEKTIRPCSRRTAGSAAGGTSTAGDVVLVGLPCASRYRTGW